jgi:dienelactone hydrolase
MRVLELSIAIGLLAYIVHILSPHRADYFWFAFVPLLCLPVAALHFLVEGYRWQMLPAYLLLCVCILCALARGTVDVQTQYIAGLVALCCLGLAIFLSTLFPVFQLPAPTGPHAVGTQVRHLTDDNRRDPVDPASPRELMVQIWYPAEASPGGRTAPYRESATTSVRDARFALVKTHSIVDAALATFDRRFPLLLYAPSWDGMRTENTLQAEELASHGYIVVGIDHPHGSLATVFPDGRIVRTKLPDENIYSSETAFSGFMKTVEAEIRIRASDAKSVLDAFQAFDAADPQNRFTNRLDLDRVGIFGFSLGGGAAAQACWLDRRFKAWVNMDGIMAGESLEHGTTAPFLVMTNGDPPSPESIPNASPAKRRELALNWAQFVQIRKLFSAHGGYWLTISQARHFNFSDYAFSSPLQIYNRSGPIVPMDASRIIGHYLLTFFDRHLKGIDRPMLDERSRRFPVVRFEQSRSIIDRQ